MRLPLIRDRFVFVAFLGFVLIFGMGGSCNPAPRLIVDSPPNGTFTAATSITVSGRIINAATNATVTVGTTSVPVQPDGSWSTSVTLDPVAIVNPLLVTAVSGRTMRERITVFNSDSVADGAYSLEAMAMRITDTGLDAMAPVMASLVTLDPATLLPVGTVLDSGCQIGGPFGTCLGSSTTSIANPPPSISSFSLDIVPITDALNGTVSIFNLDIHIQINGSGLVPTCGVRLTAAVTDLPGVYELEPGLVPGEPGLDVQQTAISVSFGGFNQTFESGICDVPIIGDLIQLIIGDLQDDVTQGFQAFLSDPDGTGPLDAPIADAIEQATAGLNLDGAIGSQIGVDMDAPTVIAAEDPNGLTIGTDASITASMPAAGAPDLLASYHVNEVFPVFPVLTPIGGLPYGLGLCLGTSAFNQLLKAEVESGLLASTITELDLFGTGTPLPLTAGLLSAFIPELNIVDPAAPFELILEPEAAPFITGAPGPAGELALMYVPHLVLKLQPTGSNVPLVEVVVDAQVGLDFNFLAGELAITIASVVPGTINIDIIGNRIDTNEAVLDAVLTFALDAALPSLADSLGSFPIPSLLGLTTSFVEASRAGQFISLWLDVN
ncbi:MAG: hypothetical protein JRH01_06830 [Deltaproteobacteria bacterium]|nr:hypothetical protein [Deltaproteobacteria bacterium]MBW2393504.1 hypothetical protein [Deltaproteobacteria bacterium]